MSLANPDAALLIIGNEILSGRTQDANLNVVAKKFGSVGVPLREVRVVPDIQTAIVRALNELRSAYTYVVTTGGIGPTHDDITVDAVARAFGVDVVEDAGARKLLGMHFGDDKLTPARLRMARIPKGAALIDNPVSGAPGVRMENVFVLAGVPVIMQGMLDGIVAHLAHGPAMHSLTVSGFVAESTVADPLRALAARFPDVDIGSYPWMREERFGTSLVARGTDGEAVRAVADELLALMKDLGVDAILSEA
ncbi:MAG: molybdopterin-binding protein [Alphaproteobacteria bacterium]|nr:molybdopterin-binding protein [Alphaproteobacteria bacterium]